MLRLVRLQEVRLSEEHSLVMSGDGHASLSSRNLNTVRQLAETNPDHIVLEKDTYLVDENNRVIPIPAGTVAVLERDTEKNAATADFSTARNVQTSHAVEMPSASSETNMPADSTSVGNTYVAAAAADGSVSTVSASCEVVEATSSDANPSVSLSDLYVQEEEEVMDESKDEEAVVTASGPVEDSAQVQSKDAAQKPGRKAAQRKSRKVSGEGQVDVARQDVRRQKSSVPADRSTPVIEKPAAKSTSTSPAVSTVSASGRPQRSTPRRSAYELLHGGESKPQRRSHTSTAESEQEGTGGKSHPSKKQKISKSGTADEEDQKQPEETKVTGEPGTGHVKGHRGRPSVHTTSQASASSEGCEGTSNCASASNGCCVSTTEMESSSCLSSNCTPAPHDIDTVPSTGAGMVNDVAKAEVDVARSQNESAKPVDDTENTSKKQKQSKKATQSKQDNCHPSSTAAVDKGSSKKKVAGKHDSDSKAAKMKVSKKPRVVGSKVDDLGDYFKVPGMPYHYFTTDSNNLPASDSDNESSSSLADDLASEDVDWMGRRIIELEQQVRRLQDGCVPQDDKLALRCWQDVLAECNELSSEENADEKLMLTRYERKLRMLDRELDERASFLQIREGCIARRERRILEKESELNKRARDLEHQRRLHGHVKLSSELSPDSNALSPGSADSSSASNRKQALEKEVRLELRKQELDRQKHVLQDERKKLAAKERELENREQALVDADLLNMASGFTSSAGVESRCVEASQANGGTTVEFSDDDDDFGGNSFSTFNAASVPLPFSLDRGKRDSDNEHEQETSEVCCTLTSCQPDC